MPAYPGKGKGEGKKGFRFGIPDQIRLFQLNFCFSDFPGLLLADFILIKMSGTTNWSICTVCIGEKNEICTWLGTD